MYPEKCTINVKKVENITANGYSVIPKEKNMGVKDSQDNPEEKRGKQEY